MTIKLKKESTVCLDCSTQYGVSVYRVVKVGNCAICGAGVEMGTTPKLCKIADKDQVIDVGRTGG